ncbi:hypothetical protein I4U23_003886 [Adineta vaga]|nr:hypothetical protein I4U23_003886 [Adineta vaga]
MSVGKVLATFENCSRFTGYSVENTIVGSTTVLYTDWALADLLPFNLYATFAVLSKQTVIRKRIYNILRLRQWNRTASIANTALPMRITNAHVAR